uniref:Solute carrier family 39 member 10 n=1 Tax=Neolamprologus brichardi TaxID=32507 RepID=A0A3Q4HGJ2_NEOBR
MRVHMHTKFCFLCVLTFLFHQCSHCHEGGHHHQHDGGVTESPGSKSGHAGDALEEEQRFYIQQLFRRYGQEDRLDFKGFQSLLFSLGLGEVKVVGLDHEDLGHDHVAHLEVLDMLHGHSSTNNDHQHDTHDFGDHNNHNHTHDEEHKHQQVNHRDLSSQPHPDHDHSNHSDHEHDYNHIHEVHTDIGGTHLDQETLEPSQVPQRLQPTPTENRPKKPRKPGRVRGQRGRDKTTSSHTPASDDHDHDNTHDHNHTHGHSHSHKDKREAPGALPVPTLPVFMPAGHPGGLTHQHEEVRFFFFIKCTCCDFQFCLNLTQLLTYYGLNPDSLISPRQFAYLCPALLYQIDRRVCILHYEQMDVEQEAFEPASSGKSKLIDLESRLNCSDECVNVMCHSVICCSSSCLQSQGQHDHSKHGADEEEDMATAFDGVWKGLTALAGIYLLFIIEHCIGMFKHYKDQRTLNLKLSDHKLNRRSDAEWLHLKPLNEDPDSTAVSCDNSHNDTQLTELQTPDSPTNKTPLAPANLGQSPAKENGRKTKKHSHGHGHSHGGNCHSDQEMKDAGIASIAWMVIMGDGMHNFSDGLAIGAAFSANLTGGISTSVAVFCHELPHELGDFAVLLKAGMSVKQAIVYNLLSALMAYVGMLIGTAVGQYTHNVTNWIFAITAGMFLYVALVDMLPEMLHGDSEEHKRCQLGHFILQNLGMLTGFAIMLLIAIFEDRIVFDFGF